MPVIKVFSLALDAFTELPVALQLATLTLAIACILRSRNALTRSTRYPPGPPLRDLVFRTWGSIPDNNPWLTYTHWAKLYGDVIHFRLLGEHTVVLNTTEAVSDLLEKKSGIYSSRPHIEMIDMMGWTFNSGLKPYGPEWRANRRLYQYTLRSVVSPGLRPITARKVNDMLYNLLLTPENFVNHYKTLAAANIMAIIYGYDISPENDYFVSLSETATAQLSLSFFPGAILVNMLPILRKLPEWFPGAGFHRFAKETRKLTNQMQEVPLNYVKKQMEDGVAPPSIAYDLLTKFTSEEDSKTIKDVCTTSYAAGSDTTASALGTFFYAMAAHPDIQRRAQKEIDDVIGSERLVSCNDRASLPYVEALVRELGRWKPVLPLGVSHCTTQDDIYNGYFIPKDTTVISNIWAMSHDERKFKNPAQFNPDRQFDEQGNLRGDYQNYIFGFGRRICPGRHLAFDTLWLVIASVLSTFDIRLNKDASGNDIPIDIKYTPGLVSHPLPFECSITPRSSQAARLIRNAQAVGKI